MTEQPAIHYNQQVADLQAALKALWPDRTKVYFAEGQGDDGPVLSDDERGQLLRVAEVIKAGRAEAEADAADAWRNFHEAQRDIDSLQRRLEAPKPVSTGEAALDRLVDEAAFEASLQALYEDARTTVAKAIGLAREIGYRQAEADAADEQLDPEAVRAVELEDEQGQRGTLIGPADKIDSLVRPEAVVRDEP